MKYSDQCWIEARAQEAMGVPPSPYEAPLTTFGQAQAVFLEELFELLNAYVTAFNSFVSVSHPELAFQIFRMSSNRPGVMLLRHRDKLVVTGDNGKISVKVVRVHAYNEKSITLLEVYTEPYDKRGNMVWKRVESGQLVTPEIVVRFFLSPFFAHGSESYFPKSELSERASGPEATI